MENTARPLPPLIWLIDKDEVDRAGNPESDYFMGWYDEYDNYHDDNAAYDNALDPGALTVFGLLRGNNHAAM